ncbi:uncharacterized protein LOC102804021 [Saccoglossus kowalevskii]
MAYYREVCFLFQSVNNYVYEEIITKDNTEQYTGCDPESLCTSNMHRNLVLKGFCCFCEDTKQLINSKYHIRGGQDCSVVDVPDYITNKSMYHASTHCLKSDNLWYQVYSIDLPVVEHKALVTIDTMNANIDLNGVVDVKDVLTTILIGTASKMHNNEVVISYSSNFDHVLDNPFADKYILAADPHYPVENGDPQTKLGAYEYLVVDKSHITFNGSECNKVGVSYPAFMNKDNACGERLMSCLDNQPYHLWFYDTNKVVQNKKGKYFAGFYGHLVEVESDWQHLVYTYTKNYSYTLRLELEVKKTHDLNIRQGENQVSFEEVSNHHGNKDSEKKNVKNRVHVTMLDEILVYDDKEKETSQDNTNQLSDATKQFINGFVIILKENLTGFNYKAEVYWCLVGGGIISMLVLLLVVKHRRRKSEKVQVPVQQNMSEKEHIIGKMENSSKTFDHIEDVFSDEEVQPAAKNSRKSSRKSKRKSKSETDVKPIIVPNATKMSTESNSSTSYNITAKNNKTRGRVRTSGTPRILPVYINLHGPDDILQNSGKEFSLCGVVIRTKSKKTPYRFEIGENTVQIFEIIKGEKKRRSKVFIIDPKHFTKLL